MNYTYNEEHKCIVCEPCCTDEWLEAIWDYGSDYDGETTVEGLKSLIDELIDCSKKARQCLAEGKIYCTNEENRRSLEEARSERDRHCSVQTAYCPLCDKEVKIKTDQCFGHCPECGHRVNFN